jgi:cation diffusion facilitator family transporter
VLIVLALTAVTMVAEIAVGYATNSMALLADGWHMATHVGALGLAGAAYALARRYAAHRALAFGTGKVRALAGYTSAVLLGAVALAMIVESIERLARPGAIDFARSLPVAALGLLVNLASVALLHAHDDHDHDAQRRDGRRRGREGHGGDDGHDGRGHDHMGHGHGHDAHGHAAHDHNHRAALLHVAADTFTSALAIVALLAGRHLRWTWLDAASGVVGGLVIVHWGVTLCRRAAAELLDASPSLALEEGIRRALEAGGDARVIDLHVWPLGAGATGCVVTLVSADPLPPEGYRARLAGFGLTHLTVEARRRAEGSAAASAAG